MPISFEDIEPLLLKVEKPGRYLGGEFNQIIKEGPEVSVRVCLAFPDVYDLGMSYHGYNLLYDRVNRTERWAAERAFTPWPDFEALLRENNLPLYSLETKRALSEFDVVGFTLQHEVNYTNMLTMMDLGGIPIDAKDRTEPFPLIVGGGEGAYSPETMAPFIDVFVIGDGEDAMDDICEVVETAKAEGWDRERLLMEIAQINGMYVPSFYEMEYLEDGRVKHVKPTREGIPEVIKKRHFNVTEDYGSTHPVVPLLRTVHDRFAIEIRRGCVNGCRFCQAGMITRPVRERSVDQIVDIAREGIRNTGYDEISLLSLSSADYTAIGTLVRSMTREFGPNRISISLPSLRINAFDVDIADEIRGVRKSGFTFAPEAGTTRLRKVINKEVDQDDFFNIINEVFSRGWQTVKFYYMLGLPTETEADLDGIIEATKHAAELGRKYHGRKAIVNVTLSPFVPKSNTPFQWEPQVQEEELHRRYQYVKSRLRHPNVDVKTSDTRSAFIEGALARGDRRVSEVVRKAWELGARFDGWDEYFQYETWLKAFEEVGLDPRFYANRTRKEDEIFPFDHIDSNLGKRFLWADQRRAWRLRVMEPCEVGKCAGCVACGDEIDHILAINQSGGSDGQERYTKDVIMNRVEKETRLAEGRQLEDPDDDSALRAAATRYRERAEQLAEELVEKASACDGEAIEPEVVEESVFTHYRKSGQPFRRFEEPEKVQRLRVRYMKIGPLRYLGHLDMAKAIAICLRRVGTPISYSEGFNPKPKIQFTPPLPLGVGGRDEIFDVTLTETVDGEKLLADLNDIAVEGLHFFAFEEVDLKADSIDSEVARSLFAIEIDPATADWSIEEIEAGLEKFQAAETFPVEVKKKRKIKTVDLKGSITQLEAESVDGKLRVTMEIDHEPGRYVQPQIALGFITDRVIQPGVGVRIDRESLMLKDAVKV